MKPLAAHAGAGLYEHDFYAWTQQQADLLRRGQVARADLNNIAEELEALGRKEVSELRSRFRILALHLLKQTYQPARSGRSWTATILNQRVEITRLVQDNPSLKSKADVIFAEAYADARELASVETGLDLDLFPRDPPFTRAEALDRSYRP
jgi:hypothetical protein